MENGIAVLNKADHYFEFESRETTSIMCINDRDLIKNKRNEFLQDEDKIFISNELFKDNALIFSNLKSKQISLKNIKNSKGITIDFIEFPYLDLWSKPKGAPSVCMEP